MNTSIRACLQFVAVIGGAAFLLMCCLAERRSLGHDLLLALLPGVPAMIAGAVLVWDWRRPDRAPDYLRQMGRPFFEHEGFCFNVAAIAEDRTIAFDVYFQNRYERRATAILSLAPSRGFFLMRGEGVSLRLPVDLPGGAFGVVRVPLALPAGVLGKPCSLDVCANVRYPEGRGRLLRFRPGLRVGKISNPNWDRLGLALNLIIAPTGGMAMSTPASMIVQFPAGDYDAPANDYVVSPRILWQPGDARLEKMPG